ncbi:MAG: hypothetical protein JWL81_2167, partial [Verrucomicrobiales bacterium]|nr:hypothetical protein [Verrucomicrobiales bacterium]
MKRSPLLPVFFACALPCLLSAQVFDGPGAPPAAPSSPGGTPPAAPAKSAFGQELPFLNPGSEVVSWNGQNWNIGDQRLFRARFEKYLAAPASTSAADVTYRDLMMKALKSLSPTQPGGPSVANAVAFLGLAADHPIDARLSDSLNQAVYSVVLYKKNARLLADMNKALAQKRKDEAWNLKVEGGATTTAPPAPKNPDGSP